MVKWADFLISEVRYNAEHTHIDKVKTHIDTGGGVGKFYEEIRSQVISNLQNHKTYYTIVKKDDGWHRGSKVDIFPVNNKLFIKTSPNQTEDDNLGELPEF